MFLSILSFIADNHIIPSTTDFQNVLNLIQYWEWRKKKKPKHQIIQTTRKQKGKMPSGPQVHTKEKIPIKEAE